MSPRRLAASLAIAAAVTLSLAASLARTQSQPTDAPPPAGFSAGLIGSKHDFTDAGRLPRDLCLPCHTPHLSPIPTGPTTRPARPVPSVRLDDAVLSESSLICLGCHDGVAAPGVLVGPHAMTWTQRDSAGLPPGGARLTSHPVGTRYPVGNPRYHSRAAVESAGLIKLPDGRIQCVSCHDPHNAGRHRGMLVESNERSRLCLACHRI